MDQNTLLSLTGDQQYVVRSEDFNALTGIVEQLLNVACSSQPGPVPTPFPTFRPPPATPFPTFRPPPATPFPTFRPPPATPFPTFRPPPATPFPTQSPTPAGKKVCYFTRGTYIINEKY